MRAPLLLLILILIIDGAADYYIWRRLSSCHRTIWSRIQLWSAIIFALTLVAVMILPARKGSEYYLLTKMWILFGYLSIYIPKYIAIIFDLIASVPMIWKSKRLKWLTTLGCLLAIISFVAMWWGALFNRLRTQVIEVEIPIEGLPESFSGLRIVQFSDLHTGTFDSDTSFVSHLVDQINTLRPDAILFTGDIVNRQSSEIIPFIPTLSRLHAPLGVYAVLGNHDYGDYFNWASETEKQANMQLLYNSYAEAGIDLIRNSHRWLRIGGDSIAVIGVENIGDPPFKIYGSLPSSYPDLSDGVTKILLSHNPQHWVDSIAGNPELNIPLTLSGHTHAMQMEVAGLSPAALRYATWGGLYNDSDIRGASSAAATSDPFYLYVNIGSGTVGFPARIGATPDITLITLRRK